MPIIQQVSVSMFMNYIIKLKVVIALCCLLPVILVKGNQLHQSFDRSALYEAMKSTQLSEVTTALTDLEKTNLPDKLAYEGALLMKKAALLSKPIDKLHSFKAGKEKLETAIQQNPDNIEYRLLRIMIQENAPKIVRYKNDLDIDGQLVNASYKKLPFAAQSAAVDYSKNSKVLHITAM
ncbi:hypothetical protein BH11BAC3_BH11BAC3_14210 [soil metagenome]